MPCINPQNVNLISNLHARQFAYPCLDWTPQLPQIGGQLKSLRGIFSVINNRIVELQFGNQANLLTHYTKIEKPEDLNENSFMIIENQLMVDITNFLMNFHEFIVDNQEQLAQVALNRLKQIAVGIQLWGGVTGRSIFVRNGGFNENFIVSSYINMIHQLIMGKRMGALNAITNIPNIGIAFGTKHLAFWSRVLMEHPIKGFTPISAPILDNNISTLLYGVLPTKKLYNQYVNIDLEYTLNEIYTINPVLNAQNFNVFHFERQIFNFSNTTEGNKWRNLRKN